MRFPNLAIGLCIAGMIFGFGLMCFGLGWGYAEGWQ